MSHKLLSTAAFAALVLVLGRPTPAAASQYGSIQGYVVDSKTNRPIVGAIVSVEVYGPYGGVRYAVAGKNGFFCLPGVDMGLYYWIPILIDGQYSSAQGFENVNVFGGQITDLGRYPYLLHTMVDIGTIPQPYRPRSALNETIDSYTIPVFPYTMH
jgi:hypothetical protein